MIYFAYQEDVEVKSMIFRGLRKFEEVMLFPALDQQVDQLYKV